MRMSRESYPSRFAHQDFIGTFTCICPQVPKVTLLTLLWCETSHFGDFAAVRDRSLC